METKDILGYLELSKKKAELEFGKNVLKQDNDADMARNKAELDDSLQRLRGAAIVSPNQRKLDDLGRVLSGYSFEEIKGALKTRSGPAYDALIQRGAIVKANSGNRLEIAKLNMELSKLSQDDRSRLSDVIKLGAIFGPLHLPSADKDAKARIARFMRRCGIPCESSGKEIRPGSPADSETRMIVFNRTVWVDLETKRKLEENLSKTQQVSVKVQLRNAERQVLSFDEEQEKGFAALQKEYLDLLKEQDELLKEFNSEESPK